MNYLAILELFSSLFVQVTVVLAVAAFVSRRGRLGVDADRCWAITHFGILLITAAALFGPHLRITTWATLHPGLNYPADGAALAKLGHACLWIWPAGAAAVVFVAIAGMFKATFLVREARPAPDLRDRLAPTAPQLALEQNTVDVRVSETCGGAFCWQVHQAVVVLPDAICDFPDAEQAAIMRHELAHLRRQHPLHLFMQRMVEAIYWFHPLVWWASRQAAAAREIRCDRDAVANRRDVAIYLRSLLRLVELRLTSPSLLPAGLGFLSKPSLLGYRANLLAESFESEERPIVRWQVLTTIGVTVLLCLIVWLPINPRASRRATWSPWPGWSARTLEAVGVPVRDFEIDGHRLDGHESSE
jgi:bla regulator protein BlaR1